MQTASGELKGVAGMILNESTVVVSGVGTGLGREVARLALRDGARVVLAARTESTLEAVAAELDPSGENVAYARTDITKTETCEALAALAIERFGAIDAVVRRTRRPGLLAILSDFFDPSPLLSSLDRAATAGHDVALLQVVCPEEVEPDLALGSRMIFSSQPCILLPVKNTNTTSRLTPIVAL